MKRENWLVTDRGAKSSPTPGKCIYCSAGVGEQHTDDCVCRLRTVVVRMTIEYVIDVPESWTASDIDFHRNESSWCSNNANHELRKLFEHIEKDDVSCLCGTTRFEYMREASTEDEQACGVFVEKLPD